MKYYTKTINGVKHEVPIINSLEIENSLDFQIKSSRYFNNNQTYIIDVGQDQITKKAYYLSKEIEKNGIKTVFFAADKTGLSEENILRDKLLVTKITMNPIQNAIKFMNLVKRYRPIHVELYLDMFPWDLMFVVFYARLKRIPLVSRCRGGEILNWEKHRSIFRLAFKYALRRSNLILIRELYMVDKIVNYEICSMDNVCFFHNHTPVPLKYTKKITKEILYLNSLKDFRNPAIMIYTALELIKRSVNFKFIVVGFTEGYMTAFNANIEEERFIRLIRDYKLENFFELHKFSNKTTEFFERASVFILPADIVFCNHSLIEAMSFQNVPLVQNVDGADLIIENGISGYLLENDPISYARIIELLFSNETHLHEMGENARERIIKDFDSNKQALKIIHYYAEKLWNIKELKSL